jgi:hypothetical protein
MTEIRNIITFSHEPCILTSSIGEDIPAGRRKVGPSPCPTAVLGLHCPGLCGDSGRGYGSFYRKTEKSSNVNSIQKNFTNSKLDFLFGLSVLPASLAWQILILGSVHLGNLQQAQLRRFPLSKSRGCVFYGNGDKNNLFPETVSWPGESPVCLFHWSFLGRA